MKYVVGHGEHPEDTKDKEHLGIQHLAREILVRYTIDITSMQIAIIFSGQFFLGAILKSFDSRSARSTLLGEKLPSGEDVHPVTPWLLLHLTLTEVIIT